MSKTTTSLSGQLDLFGEQSGAWHNDHNAAMACLDFEEVVAFGSFIYERIRNIDAEWSAEMERDQTEPLEGDALAVEAPYDKWRGSARQNLTKAAEFERAGHVVKGIEQLRAAYDEVEEILSVSVVRLRNARKNIAEGRARSWGEVRNYGVARRPMNSVAPLS